MQTPPPRQEPADPNAPQGAPEASVAPLLKDTYQGGVRDYNAAHYDVAASEFQDVLHYYPTDDLAGAAQFYLGEIAYHQEDYADAVKAYTAVIEGFPGSAKAPAAQLKKGFSLLQLNKKDLASTSCARSSSAIRRLLKPTRPASGSTAWVCASTRQTTDPSARTTHEKSPAWRGAFLALLPCNRLYCRLAISPSSADFGGRVRLSGSVASGSSTTFNRSMKVGFPVLM